MLTLILFYTNIKLLCHSYAKILHFHVWLYTYLLWISIFNDAITGLRPCLASVEYSFSIICISTNIKCAIISAALDTIIFIFGEMQFLCYWQAAAGCLLAGCVVGVWLEVVLAACMVTVLTGRQVVVFVGR